MPLLRISDHATARYCERVLGLDMDALQKAMNKLVGDNDAGEFRVPGHDIVAVVKNRTITTFIPAEHISIQSKHAARKRLNRHRRPREADEQE